MRKITDEGFLFLYGVGLLVTAETGLPAVIAILLVCIYTCVNLVGEEKYLHYIMTIVFVVTGIVFKEMWIFLPVVLPEPFGPSSPKISPSSMSSDRWSSANRSP